ncbi:MAG: lysylphosphatidylglycerol synthase domain-containing protein [Halofilum sp. (in: g-proteobacteria)]|nr:lysylphosphatidylglycerol synthase domain-containing protein [Halofilum sp. (in: g-proteobacteria)]
MAEPATRTRFRDRHPWLRALLWSVIWLALLVSLLWNLEAWPEASAWRELGNPASGPALSGFLLIFLAVTAVRARRWQILLQARTAFPWRRVWPIFFWTFLLKSLTPLRAGEVLRALWLRRHQHDGFGYGLATIAIERAADVLILVGGGSLLVLGGVMAAPETVGNHAVLLAILAGIVLLGLLLLPLSRRGPAQAGAPTGARRGCPHARPFAAMLQNAAAKACKPILSTIDGLNALRQPLLAAHVLALTLAVWGGLVLGYGLVLNTLLPAAPWAAVVAMVAAVNLLGITAGPPGNLGTYEIGGLAALAAFGIDAASALPVIVLLHAAVLAATLLAGVIGRFALHRELDGILDPY